MKDKKRGAYLSVDLVFSLLILSIGVYIFSIYVADVNLWKAKNKESLDMQYRLNNQVREDVNMIENKKEISKEDIDEFAKDGPYTFRKKVNLLDSKYGLIELDESISNGETVKNIKAYAIIAGDLSL